MAAFILIPKWTTSVEIVNAWHNKNFTKYAENRTLYIQCFALASTDDEHKIMQFDPSDKYEAWVDILTCLTMGFQCKFTLFAGSAFMPQYFIQSDDLMTVSTTVNTNSDNDARRYVIDTPD